MVTTPNTARLDGLIQRARDALATDATSESTVRIDQRLQILAAELMLEWVVGDKRFESSSQQTEYWLSRFYDEIFTDEQPDATRIYTRFGLTLPRAGYVARLLRARSTPTWRQAARVELAKRLREKRAVAKQAEKDDLAHVTDLDIHLTPGAADELRVLYDRTAAAMGEAEQPKPPKAKSAYSRTRLLSVPADTLLLLLKQLDAGEKRK